MAWMAFTIIMLGERRQTQKRKYCMLPFYNVHKEAKLRYGVRSQNGCCLWEGNRNWKGAQRGASGAFPLGGVAQLSLLCENSLGCMLIICVPFSILQFNTEFTRKGEEIIDSAIKLLGFML